MWDTGWSRLLKLPCASCERSFVCIKSAQQFGQTLCSYEGNTLVIISTQLHISLLFQESESKSNTEEEAFEKGASGTKILPPVYRHQSPGPLIRSGPSLVCWAWPTLTNTYCSECMCAHTPMKRVQTFITLDGVYSQQLAQLDWNRSCSTVGKCTPSEQQHLNVM